MKNLLKLFIIAVLVVSSCSDDDTNNPVNPPSSDTLYALDSLTASVNAGATGFNSNSASFGTTTSATVVRLEYTLQSNADSSLGCIASYRDSTNGSPIPPSPLRVYVYSPVDTSYSFTYNVTTQPFFAGFDVTIAVTQQNSIWSYIRFKNIKVIKVQ